MILNFSASCHTCSNPPGLRSRLQNFSRQRKHCCIIALSLFNFSALTHITRPSHRYFSETRLTSGCGRCQSDRCHDGHLDHCHFRDDRSCRIPYRHDDFHAAHDIWGRNPGCTNRRAQSRPDRGRHHIYGSACASFWNAPAALEDRSARDA